MKQCKELALKVKMGGKVMESELPPPAGGAQAAPREWWFSGQREASARTIGEHMRTNQAILNRMSLGLQTSR